MEYSYFKSGKLNETVSDNFICFNNKIYILVKCQGSDLIHALNYHFEKSSECMPKILLTMQVRKCK